MTPNQFSVMARGREEARELTNDDGCGVEDLHAVGSRREPAQIDLNLTERALRGRERLLRRGDGAAGRKDANRRQRDSASVADVQIEQAGDGQDVSATVTY